MPAEQSDPKWIIKMLEIELSDELESSVERNRAALRILDEIVANRVDPSAVAELAITAKNVLRRGWV